MGETNCKWLGIQLRSPIVLASLTLFSKPNIHKHFEYLERAAQYGVGAIVLPSIHPLRRDESVGRPHVRAVPISSGLGKVTDYLAFSVLGTTDNIVSINYGLQLAKEAVKLDVPVLASVANIGTKVDFLNAIKQVCTIDGLAGLELNFSCPNVLNGLALSVSLLEDVFQEANRLPISIKCAPQMDFSCILKSKALFSGITCSNAYSGLVPPSLKLGEISPFGADTQLWRPTGIYGPQEKLLTFYDIWKFKTDNKLKDVQLSSVGGFVAPQDVLQAIMLGADTVQLSSAIFWKGLKIIKECNQEIVTFLKNKNCTLDMLRGSGLQYVKASDADLQEQRPIRTMHVDVRRCLNCKDCACVEHGCYAFHKTEGQCAEIDDNLCNGCGWCQSMCVQQAIEVDYKL